MTPIRLLTAGALAVAWGCTDPRAEFREFVDRIPDASIAPDAATQSALADITGPALVAVRVPIAPDNLLLFRAENILTVNDDGTGVLDVSVTPLTLETLEPIGNTIQATGVEVNEEGEFTAFFGDITVEPAANPFPTGGTIVGSELTLVGRIVSADLNCGDVTGLVEQPITLDLKGSRYGSVRIDEEAGTLPEPVFQCP